MCGEDKEKNTMEKTEKKGAQQGMSDVAISKLLQDFSCAELFPQSVDKSSGQPGASSTSNCEAVVVSLKNLHLRRPANGRRKISRRPNSRKRHSSNSLNIAVAAGNFQKPIVWPARLSSEYRRGSPQILNPSRLCVGAAKDNKDNSAHQAASVKDTTKLPEAACDKESEISRQPHFDLFGSASSVDYSSLSFSSLCKQSHNTPAINGTNNPTSCTSSSIPSVTESKVTTSPMSKRCSTSSVPPAKFARTVGQEDGLLSNHGAFSEYRHADVENSGHNQPHSHREASQQSALSSSEDASTSSSPLSLVALQSALVSSTHATDNGLNHPSSHEPRMEETNVNELASYFEDLLHIPRKMSTMAEMMYA